jgi:hypothetical protein
MRVTRKEFLSSLAVGLAGAAWRPARLLAASPDETTIPPNTFERNVGTTFQLIRSSGMSPIDFVLQSVDRMPDSPGTVQFSLTFLAPGGENLPEKTYSFEHAELGSLAIFVSKVRTDPNGQTWYRADFNLLQPDAAPQKRRKTVTLPGRG